jgi:carboxyl-terminal processing protease
VPIGSVVDALAPQFLSQADPAARHWALQVALAGRHEQTRIRLTAQQGGKRQQLTYSPDFPQPTAPLSARVIDGVGYVRIHNALGDSTLVAAFDAALATMTEARALVIDLRGTPSGGTSSVARGIMGRLVSQTQPYQRHELVSEFRESGIRRVWVEYVAPRGSPFLVPVVLLVGPWTGSMGEGLAIGLNAARGAPVVGQPMAHLLGALGETVLPHSKIAVRVPTEKLFHFDGSPREAFVPCQAESATPAAVAASGYADAELRFALELALKLSQGKTGACAP